ncbi:hypothetical protein ACFX2G_033153 [Malus domestica]
MRAGHPGRGDWMHTCCSSGHRRKLEKLGELGVSLSFHSLHSLREQFFSSSLSSSELLAVKTQNGKVMAGDLPPLMVRLKAFRETYSEADIRGILSGLDSDFGDEIHPSLR